MFRKLLEFASNRAGGVAMVFALAVPSMIGVTGAAVDYTSISRQKTSLAALTDAAALSVGRQMTQSTMTDAQIQAAAVNFAQSNVDASALTGLTLTAKTSTDRLAVTVAATAGAKSSFGLLELAVGAITLNASATARVGQNTKLCLLSVAEAKSNEIKSGLFVSAEKTGIALMDNSRISAPGCLLHTNVPDRSAFTIGPGAQVTADVLCAVGGVTNTGGMIDAAVVDTCPKVTNPMDGRFYPNLGQNCPSTAYKDITLTTGTHTLSPGNYCGNIAISGDAKVRLGSGNFSIQGKLVVKGNAEFVGTGVGIYLWGGNASLLKAATFAFLENSLIDLTGPETGPMAGVVIWEGINGAAHDVISGYSTGNYHQISTMRAKRLTGTIYLPGGRLRIDAPGKVADQSDYTVMVVNRLDLAAGPNLVLNSDYAKSRIPVPVGLGPIGAKNVRLVN